MADSDGSESESDAGCKLNSEDRSLSVNSEGGENDLDLCIQNAQEIQDDDDLEQDEYSEESGKAAVIKLIEMFEIRLHIETTLGLDEMPESSLHELLALRIIQMRKKRRQISEQPSRFCKKSRLTGGGWLNEILHGRYAYLFQSAVMDSPTFARFCEVLKEGKYIAEDPTGHVSAEEAVALFLVMMSSNELVRGLADIVQYSQETINHNILRAVQSIARFSPVIVASRNQQQGGHSKILKNAKLNPWFKDCIGAVDCKHIPAWPVERQGAYRNRQGKLSQNVMFACDLDMRFVYVLAGWEGSAHDKRVFDSALCKGFSVPTQGKYYLVDKLYRNRPGFLAPFLGHRYHERQFKGKLNEAPTSAEELFNQRHCLLRNVIERCFKVLMRRFHFLSEPMQKFDIKYQVRFVFACCAVHNFIREHNREDQIFAEFDDGDGADGEQPLQNHEFQETHQAEEPSDDQWNAWRASLANRMWNAEMAGP